MNESRQRIPEFEIIRTISILMLLIHHSGLYIIPIFGVSIEWLSPFFEAFLLGSFLLISGYFMEASLQKSGGNLIAFFLSRLPRIYPPYLIALLLYVIVMGITLKTRTDWLVYLGALQFIFAPEFVKPMLTLWYIGAILLYYIVFLALWRLAQTGRQFILFAATTFFFIYLLHLYTGLFDVRFFKYYFVFLAGMLFSRTEGSGAILSADGFARKGVLGIFGVWVFSLVAYSESARASMPYVAASFLFIVPAFLFLYALIARLAVHTPWKWVTSVSHASFFVYLFHRPLWVMFANLIPLDTLQNQVLFRLVPASVLVIVICYYLQRTYDSLLGAVRHKLVH